MPRPFRVYIEGLSVHAMHRGINRMQIFDDAEDYEVFLGIVRHGARQEGIDIHTYAVMSNHYHLQVTPKHALALPRAMKRVHSDYSCYYNRKHRRTGTIWGNRYRPVLIEGDRRWLACLRYIEQNPVRAGIVSRAEDYAWSSYRVHALGEPSSWLVPHPVYLALGSTPRARQEAYATICSNPLTESELQRCSRADTSKPRRLVLPTSVDPSDAVAVE